MAKILIADDEPEIIQFCTFVLQRGNHTLLSTENGPKAMEILRKDKPDLLILDVMLPGLDGYTLQLQMSQDEVLSHIPVIIITALKPSQGLFSKFEQVASFLPKPFAAEHLIKAVDHALSGSGQEA